VVTVATNPPQVFSGDAVTAEDAEDAAAQQALTAILSSTSVEVSFRLSCCCCHQQ